MNDFGLNLNNRDGEEEFDDNNRSQEDTTGSSAPVGEQNFDIPENLSYSEDHVWVDSSVSPALVGITAYAAEQLGDIVYIDFPEEGDQVRVGDEPVELESAKAISPVVIPVEGTIAYVNTAADSDPQVVTNDPYGEGWLLKINLEDDEPDLLNSEEYARAIEQQSKK